MFSIDATDLHWMDGVPAKEDRCLHGHATARIGTETFQYDATVSATALYLLKSLKKDHKIYESNQMLPCCGFFMIANEDLSSVDICGCPNGIDWSVLHEGDTVVLVTAAGNTVRIPWEDYRATVFAFADKIEAFYKKSEPKAIPHDAFEEDGYQAFWNEWRAIRYGI